MNILCISKDLSIGPMAIRLKKEGHAVRLFVEDEKDRDNLEGLIEKTEDWKKELDWVGKDGLIVFDCVGFGEDQDSLRGEGFSVVGGSAFGDRLEHDRQFGQKILSLAGVEIVPSINFCSAGEAIEFVKKNKGPWVVKQNGHTNKTFNYVGRMDGNEDVVAILESYELHDKEECNSIDLQKKIEGVEIGIGRYFNGTDWVGPIEINLEHKGLFNGNLGPKTYEMGTLMWYESDENNRLYQETLAKLKPFLEKGNFRGDVDVNCIVNEEGVFPLEFTARFGFPALQLQSELHESPWGEFLKAVADGKSYDLKYKKDFGIVVLVAVPPFPYEIEVEKYSPVGMEIKFKEGFEEKDFEHIHLEGVSFKKDGSEGKYYISGKDGFVLHVSGAGKTVEEARDKTYNLIKKIVIPKMFYRTDIGQKFMKKDQARLKEWGWLR